MDVHPAAGIFPIDEQSIGELSDDIKKHGLLCPIELFNGLVIDGRRRLRACQLAKVEPDFVDVTPSDPVAYVLSLNLHRRHLTPSQFAMCAARARDFYDEQAKERKKRKPEKSVPENLPEQNRDARDAVGKAFGVSGKTVDFATKVLRQGTPELVRAVDEGRMAVSTAAVYASEPAEVQHKVVSDPKRNRTYTSLAKTNGEAAKEQPVEPEPGTSRGVGIRYAHEAIACLKKIPKKDGLRASGFQLVADWIKHNK